MKYIVTGGLGFIGANLVNNLIEDDNINQIIVIDDLSSGKLENIKTSSKVKVIQACVSQTDLYGSELVYADVIVHLAANASVEMSVLNPVGTLNNNVTCTLKLFEFVLKNNKDVKIIFASSAAVYGDCGEVAVTEDLSLNPTSPYAIEKLMIEKYAYYYNKIHNMNITALRFFNVYGPLQDPNSPYSGVISIFFEKMKNDESIKLFGDGKTVRDFIFVADIVNAIKLASTSSVNDIFNVASGKECTILDLIAALQNSFNNKEVKIEYCDFRVGDIRYSKSNIEKIQTCLKFNPMYTLDEGIKEYYESIS